MGLDYRLYSNTKKCWRLSSVITSIVVKSLLQLKCYTTVTGNVGVTRQNTLLLSECNQI